MASAQPLSVEAVNWLGETADGLSDTDGVGLVRTKSGEVCVKKEDAAAGDVLLCKINRHGKHRKNRLTPESVTIKAKGCGPIPLHEFCDALFWTDSAVEKFLLPYYHAQRLLTDNQMKQLQSDWSADKVIAIAHMPPSQAKPIPGLRRGATGPVAPRAVDSIVLVKQIRTADDGCETTWTTLGAYLDESAANQNVDPETADPARAARGVWAGR